MYSSPLILLHSYNKLEEHDKKLEYSIIHYMFQKIFESMVNMEVSLLLFTILGVIALNGSMGKNHTLDINLPVDAPFPNEWQQIAVETHPRRKKSANDWNKIAFETHPRRKRSGKPCSKLGR